MNMDYFVKSSFLILITIGLSSCTSFNLREYKPFVRSIDGKSELHISTYPAWFPKKQPNSNSINKKIESHDEVYFQISIRDINKKFGPNTHINSVKIHSFSYKLPNESEIEILAGYDGSFWMQGNPNHNGHKLTAIPYRTDSTLSIKIKFTLNGELYFYEGEMKAKESKTVLPTSIANRSI